MCHIHTSCDHFFFDNRTFLNSSLTAAVSVRKERGSAITLFTCIRRRRHHHLSKRTYYTRCVYNVAWFSGEYIQSFFFYTISRQFRTVSGDVYNNIYSISISIYIYIRRVYAYSNNNNILPRLKWLARTKKNKKYKYGTGSVPNTFTFKGYFTCGNIRVCQIIRETHRCTYYCVSKRNSSVRQCKCV